MPCTVEKNVIMGRKGGRKRNRKKKKRGRN
jgi:hypothetical protein